MITDFIATFTTPQQIGTTPASVLWILPLLASIAIVYKATKMQKITACGLIKETALLFVSIAVFIFITALILYAIAWIIAA